MSRPLLRLFEHQDDSGPSPDWTLLEFFDRWYRPAFLGDVSRRPPSEQTLLRRRKPLEYWQMVIGCVPIGQITAQHLLAFREGLSTVTYRRGPLGFPRPLSEVSQQRCLQEVQLVLGAAGSLGRGPRAGVLAAVPKIWAEPITCFPPDVWTIQEARLIGAAIPSVDPPKVRRGPAFDRAQMVAIAQALLALWFFTGHRATTYRILRWDHLAETRPGVWMLSIPASVKTGKRDRLRVHPQLLACLERLRGLDVIRMFPLAFNYSTLADWHGRWLAVLPAARRLPIKAWRALHSAELGSLGLSSVQQLSTAALGHSSFSVTRGSYFDPRNLLLPLLPDLFE